LNHKILEPKGGVAVK